MKAPEAKVSTNAYEIGQTVVHDRFGRGTVVGLQPEKGRITVDFVDCGTKILAVDKAKLTVVE